MKTIMKKITYFSLSLLIASLFLSGASFAQYFPARALAPSFVMPYSMPFWGGPNMNPLYSPGFNAPPSGPYFAPLYPITNNLYPVSDMPPSMIGTAGITPLIFSSESLSSVTNIDQIRLTNLETNFLSSNRSLSTTGPMILTSGYDYPSISTQSLNAGTGYLTFVNAFLPFSRFITTILPGSPSASGSGAADIRERPYEFVSAGEIPQSEGYTGVYDPYEGYYPYGYYGGYSSGSGGEPIREIEEADIVEIDGNNLYILNEYRGLIICDISQTDALSITGKAAINGHPEEMYIRDDRAYIITTNHTNSALSCTWGEDTPSSLPESLSHIVVVDLTNKALPDMMGSFDIEGEVTDSRIVGDILYVVSSRPPEADVYINQDPQSHISVFSIDISDPANIHLVDQGDFNGAAKYIHVSEEAIFIVSAIELLYGDKTIVTYVDISDPAGIVHMGDSIEIPGLVKDEFKIDYYEGYLRVCTYDWSEDASSIYIIDTNDPNYLLMVGQVEVGQGDQLFATRFDGPRAYIVTFNRSDTPLWIVDLNDPADPQVKGEIEIYGRTTFVKPCGDRLIVLNYNYNNSYNQKISISLFNVTDPEHPWLITRLFFGNQGGWSSSVAFNDIESFTFFDDLGLILLPYSISDYVGDRYYSDDRLQLIDFSPDGLTARGWISQKGDVLRSRSFNDRLFSISTKQLQVIEASNRDNPQVTASLALIRDIADFIPLDNGYGIQVIREDSGTYTLRAVPLSSPEDGQAASELKLHLSLNDERSPFIIANGHMVSMIMDVLSSSSTQPYFTRIQILDFSDASHPSVHGFLDIPGNYTDLKSINGRMSVSECAYSQDIIQLKDDVLIFNHLPNAYYSTSYSTSGNFNELLVVDLSNPDHPALISTILIDIATPMGLFTKGGILYFSYSLPTYEASLYGSTTGYPETPMVRYYLGRIDLSDPSSPVELDPINIPGFCVGLSDSGNFAYTINKEWDPPTIYSRYSQTYSFNVVQIVSDKAYLFGKAELSAYFSSGVIDHHYAYLSASEFNSYYGNCYGGSREFAIIDLTDPEDPVQYEHIWDEGCGAIFAAKGGKIFATTSGGIGCYDVTDPGIPQLEDYRNWFGQSNRVVFFDNKAYFPLGYYGLWVKNL